MGEGAPVPDSRQGCDRNVSGPGRDEHSSQPQHLHLRSASRHPRAAALFDLSRPTSSEIHLVESGAALHLLAVDGSRFYDVDPDTYRRLGAAVADGTSETTLRELGLSRATRAIDDAPPADPPVRALSLAIAQKCNLSCTYCYAQQGSFGSSPQNMPGDTAKRAVDLLLSEAAAGDRVNLSFLGGEPLVNRSVLRETTIYAARAAARRGIAIGLSITTNGTLIEES